MTKSFTGSPSIFSVLRETATPAEADVRVMACYLGKLSKQTFSEPVGTRNTANNGSEQLQLQRADHRTAITPSAGEQVGGSGKMPRGTQHQIRYDQYRFQAEGNLRLN